MLTFFFYFPNLAAWYFTVVRNYFLVTPGSERISKDVWFDSCLFLMEGRIVWIKLYQWVMPDFVSLHFQVTQFTVLYVTQITILCVTQFWCLCNTIPSSVHACTIFFNHFEKRLFSHKRKDIYSILQWTMTILIDLLSCKL